MLSKIVKTSKLFRNCHLTKLSCLVAVMFFLIVNIFFFFIQVLVCVHYYSVKDLVQEQNGVILWITVCFCTIFQENSLKNVKY